MRSLLLFFLLSLATTVLAQEYGLHLRTEHGVKALASFKFGEELPDAMGGYVFSLGAEYRFSSGVFFTVDYRRSQVQRIRFGNFTRLPEEVNGRPFVVGTLGYMGYAEQRVAVGIGISKSLHRWRFACSGEYSLDFNRRAQGIGYAYHGGRIDVWEVPEIDFNTLNPTFGAEGATYRINRYGLLSATGSITYQLSFRLSAGLTYRMDLLNRIATLELVNVEADKGPVQPAIQDIRARFATLGLYYRLGWQ